LGVERRDHVVGLQLHGDAVRPASEGDLLADDGAVGDHRPGRGGAEGGDGAALVAGRRQGLVGTRQRHPAHPEQRAQLRPADLPVTGDQHEQVVAGSPSYDQGLDHRGR
jgi:hypothetical protein